MKTLIAALTFTILIAAPALVGSATAASAQVFHGYPLGDWYSQRDSW
jgi:hypothetical protein